MAEGSAAERVKEAVDIVSVVGRFVHLTRSGRNMKGLCPFHKEKTPSFMVSPDRQTFHCFGCGAGGDVFTFMMNFFGMSFRDALEELASEHGVDVSGPSAPDPAAGLRKLLADAHSHFVTGLAGPSGGAARDYLASRGISPATCTELGVGWAQGGGDLLRRLSSAGYSDSMAVEAGLAVRSDTGRIYERFRERLVFPIRDRRGRTVSFGGRSLGQAEPKYLNGPDTELYHKGDLLYGLSAARSAARDTETVILVEGYFDHARLFEAGLHCVVATCGTALTPSQARQLVSLAPGVLLCFDGDDAGRKAAMKAVSTLLAEGCYPGVVALDGVDPDEFVAKMGVDAFVGRLESASDPVSFALSLAGGWESLVRRGRSVTAVKRLVTLAAAASGPVLRETVLRRIADETGHSVGALEAQLSMDHPPPQPDGRAAGAEDVPAADLALLRAVLSGEGGGFDTELLEFLDPGDFSPGPARDLFTEFRNQASDGGSGPIPGRMPRAMASLCSRLSMDSRAVLGEDDRERIRERVGKARRSSMLAGLLSRLAGASGERKKELLKEIAGLTGSPSPRGGDG